MESQQDSPNEDTRQRTGERVRYDRAYKAGCCAVTRSYSQGDVFSACPEGHGHTFWNWIPPFVPENEWSVDALLASWRQRRAHQVHVVDSIGAGDKVVHGVPPKPTIVLADNAPWHLRDKAVHVISPKGFVVGTSFGAPSIASNPQILLQAEIVVFGDKSSEGQIIQAVALPWFEILKELETNPEFLHELTPRKFEEFIAAAYKRDGWPEVVLTPQSGDRGRDVIATKPGVGSIRFFDQVKKYAPNHKVAAEDVRALLGVLTAQRNVSKGIITTTSEFAPGIFKDHEIMAFTPHRLELKDGKQLNNWLLSLPRAR